ncbi:GNAT family N-acetyltransferase [Streptomyces sp. PSKA30]|uniref:GNAT family N-acetyltransferase n=1 Tax=Streptomyces sp. PSKA30 TaxID=2874597 RepID=UPI001CD079E4|nr:GNAT family N-acetyltransferase [Streptomyces sp. PSKA30]MBZ9638743.1 GNAT family N-acetyltransferase [Streptomyces sp. PSKA30]
MKDDQVARVHERLAARPELCPVAFGGGRRFGLWDLASLAEGALGECVDPESLTVSSEKGWRLRLGSEGRERRHDDFRRRYWIHVPGSRSASGPMGTIAVDTWPVGVGAVRISSLYVHPVARRQGLASTALDTVYDACRAEGLYGFRLDTHWTWQPTVHYYLGRRLWVTSWKHALGLARLSYLPRYEVREGADGEVTFLVADAEGELVPLLVAGSANGRLCLRETEQHRRLSEKRDALRLYARSTLALHLAIRGRPLVRGEKEWAHAHRWCDIGEPEGLAYKIGVFERVAREDGWRVESPYASLSALGVRGEGNSDAGSATGLEDR